MGNWEKTTKNIGKCYAGSKVKVTFKATEDALEIQKVTPSCGCTVTEFNREDGLLVATYKPSFPKHLNNEPYVNSRKTISIRYVDGTIEVLTFTAKIYRK